MVRADGYVMSWISASETDAGPAPDGQTGSTPPSA